MKETVASRPKLVITMMLFYLCNLSSQSTEIDFSIGSHLSKSNFHHSSELTVNKDYSLFDNFGTQYIIGLSSKIRKNWKLRSELGFVTTNSFFIISYKFDEGFGIKDKVLASWLTNQKIYLGILPEYYIEKSKFNYFVNGGVLFTTDINNTLSSINTVLLPNSSPLGLNLGAGIIYKFNTIGIKLNLGYTKFTKSQLFNEDHPFISYQHINVGLGLVYRVSKE